MKFTSLPNAGYHIGTKNYDFDLFEGIEAARLSLKHSAQVYWFSPSGSVNTLKRCDEVASLDKWQKKGLVNSYKAFTYPRQIPTFFCVAPQS